MTSGCKIFSNHRTEILPITIHKIIQEQFSIFEIVSQDDVKANLNLTLPRKFRSFPFWRGKARMSLVAKNGSYDSNMCSSEEKAQSLPRGSWRSVAGEERRRSERSKREEREETEGLDFYQCPMYRSPSSWRTNQLSRSF